MSDTALLIVDMQVGNFSEPAPIYKGDELLAKVKNLITRARCAQIPIFYVQNNGGSGDPDAYGTPGWEIHPSISPVEGDVVVQKQAPDAFHETNLHRELESIGIEKLVIAGLQTEYCIDTTCRRAFSLGYKVLLVKDAHSTWDSQSFTAKQIIEHHNQVLGGWFVTLKNEREIEF
ncbi:MAG: cysteine hydrolase [Candidatus Bathyarchaeota archaeon]|nr:cysteine hydrolase [Candidatus Bathyarchaeota archaeon]MDH5712687.1 cysteine hydrolase [Candidatus Bathyarchaeota archaeon]